MNSIMEPWTETPHGPETHWRHRYKSIHITVGAVSNNAILHRGDNRAPDCSSGETGELAVKQIPMGLRPEE